MGERMHARFSYLDKRSNKYTRSVCRFLSSACTKVAIKMPLIHKHSILFETDPEFLYQEVHVVYQSEILGENKEQI